MQLEEGIAASRRRKRYCAFAAAILCSSTVLFALVPIARNPNAAFVDFRAFDCGAKVVAAGSNPYRVQPLFSCEQRVRQLSATSFRWRLPAPLPAAAFALLFPMTLLPFDVAVAVWFGVILFAVAAIVHIVQRMTGLPLAAVIAAFSLSEGYAALDVGQIAPIAVAAIVALAWAVTTKRYRLAAVFGTCSLIEPHLGIPAMLAIVMWVPRARLATAVGAATLALVCVLLVGYDANVEYVRSALPQQALSEAFTWNQYSLTFLLTSLGAPVAEAVRWGSLSYIVVVALGTALAPIVAKRLCAPAALVLFPVAAATFGGVYLHVQQLAAALPFALLLFAKRPTSMTLAALTTLTIPGYLLFAKPIAAVPLAVGVVAMLYGMLEPRPQARTAGVLAFVCLVFALPLTFSRLRVVSTAPRQSASPIFASEDWRRFKWANRFQPEAGLLVATVPVWIGLAVLLSAPLRRRKDLNDRAPTGAQWTVQPLGGLPQPDWT